MEGLPGDIGGFLGTEEIHHAGNFFGLADAFGGYTGFHFIELFLGQYALQAVVPDNARCDGVNGDPVFGQIQGHRTRVAGNSRFGGCVGRLTDTGVVGVH